MASYEKTALEPKDRAEVDNAKAARDKFWSIREKVVLAPSREMKTKEAMTGYREQLQPAFETYIDALTTLENSNKRDALASGGDILKGVRTAQTEAVAGGVASLVIGIGLALFIIQSTTRTLKRVTVHLDESTEQVSSAASQISGASQTLASGASEQAASLEETSASLEQMASMCSRNADNAQSAKTIASETRAAADTGASDMQAMNAAMSDIQTSGDNISKIIKTIDEIAFQTNILALNAAVEAARAGDAGMGFAVVADEVRNLAQRSAKAARETADKIEDSIVKSRNGVTLSAKVASSLNEIVAKAGRVDELVAEIAQASKEQAQGIGQVNQAMAQMDKVTQSNAASAEEAASASEELHALSRGVQDSVERLKELMGQNSAGKLHAPESRARKSSTGRKDVSSAASNAESMAASFAGAVEANASAESRTALRPRMTDRMSDSFRRKTIPLESDFQNF
jgi:methyl-accepting chemotaxis protein